MVWSANNNVALTVTSQHSVIKLQDNVKVDANQVGKEARVIRVWTFDYFILNVEEISYVTFNLNNSDNNSITNLTWFFNELL